MYVSWKRTDQEKYYQDFTFCMIILNAFLERCLNVRGILTFHTFDPIREKEFCLKR